MYNRGNNAVAKSSVRSTVRRNVEASAYLEHIRGRGDVAKLERRIADHYGVKYAVCTSSATVALLAVCLALDLKEIDFITSPLNFGAGLAGWLLRGNRPVFADVEPDTLTLDPDAISKVATPRTKAILSVDYAGYPADDRRTRDAADDLGLWYVSDSAQSLGAVRDGRPAGSLAHAAVISLNSQKTIRCGEGGAIVTDRQDIYERIIWTSQHPARQQLELGLRVYNEFAFSSRIHPAAAAQALSVFDESLMALSSYQDLCVELIALLKEAGLIERTRPLIGDIVPTFFGVAVTPCVDSGPVHILEFLRERGYECNASYGIGPPIYLNDVFIQQYHDQFLVPAACAVAEGAVSRMSLSGIRRVGKQEKL